MRPHKKLEVWKEAMELTKMIYKTTPLFPTDERFGMISQLKRASVSVPANIAEGAARQHKKEFRQFLFIANGSLSEIDTLFELAFQMDFVDKTEYKELSIQLEKVSAMNNGLIKALNQQITS